MNRRAPVRSVLAERRMFANGGMLPISTPFQNTMNQGQPSGILASSSPLIDSVSQEILAPLTGGAMPMAQGGVAKFQEGGSIGAPSQNPEDFLQEGRSFVELGYFVPEELDAYTQLRAFGLGQASAMLGLNSINTFRAKNPEASEKDAINFVVRNSRQELSLTPAERNILQDQDKILLEFDRRNIVPGPDEPLGPLGAPDTVAPQEPPLGGGPPVTIQMPPPLGVPQIGPPIDALEQMPLPGDMIEPGTLDFVPSDPQRRLVPRSEAGGFKWDPTATLPINVSETLQELPLGAPPVGPSIEQGNELLDDVIRYQRQRQGEIRKGMVPPPQMGGGPSVTIPMSQMGMSLPADMIEPGASALAPTPIRRGPAETWPINASETLISAAPWQTDDYGKGPAWRPDPIADPPQGEEGTQISAPGTTVQQEAALMREALAQGPEAYKAFLQKFSANPNFSEEFKQAVVGTVGDVSPQEKPELEWEPKYTTELGGLRDFLGKNEISSTDDIPSSVLTQSVDAIIDEAISGIQGKTFDKEAFKQEIETLLPVVGKDPETEGYLIALLGASIMAGKDPNAWVNVGAGVEKALPAIINFKTRKKEAEHARKMTVAKLTIEEGLSRDKEMRAAVNALETTRTTLGLDEVKRLLTPEDWWVSKSTTLDPQLIGGKEGDLPVFVPRGTTLSLNELEYNKLSSLGVTAVPFSRGSWSPSDFMNNEDTLASAAHVKAMNVYGTLTKVRIFEAFKKVGAMNITYMTVNPGAMLAGARNENMINISELNAFMREYYNVKQPTINLRNDVREILATVMTDPRKMTGFGRMLDQTADVIRGIAGNDSEAARYLESLGATPHLGLEAQAKVKALIVLAKLAPLLLDESGKTISDADRKMIAATLGLSITYNDPDDESKGFRVTMNPGMFSNPEAIILAISKTEQALNNRLNEVNASAKAYLSQFGYPSSAKEMLALEEKQKIEMEKDPFELLTKGAATLDFDFTKPPNL